MSEPVKQRLSDDEVAAYTQFAFEASVLSELALDLRDLRIDYARLAAERDRLELQKREAAAQIATCIRIMQAAEEHHPNQFPGHAHRIRSVWDDTNKRCKLCRDWQAAKDSRAAVAMLSELSRLTAENDRLQALPCDSDAANDWLNKNAPQDVIEALWAWRRISVEGLSKHKERIAELEDENTRLREQVQDGERENAELRARLGYPPK